MPFQILSLSGGGYRGLFTVSVLAHLEKQAGRPIGQCFDMIAGTSIGGIIAIGLAMGKTAAEIKATFLERGEAIFPAPPPPPRGKVGRLWKLWSDYKGGPKYDGKALRETILEVVGEKSLIGDARTRLIIPAINMTKGSVQMFKTPHDPRLVVDLHRKAVDVAMATSAAPLFFPMARMDNSYYVDGGLVANAPDACAVHEAVHFAGQDIDDVHLLSVGTTTTGFSLPGSLGGNFGPAEWLEKERLISTVFSAQQQLVDFMVGHQLGNRYLRIDSVASAEQIADLGLDLAGPGMQRTLQGMAEGAYQRVASEEIVRRMLAHQPEPPPFVATRASQ